MIITTLLLQQQPSHLIRQARAHFQLPQLALTTTQLLPSPHQVALEAEQLATLLHPVTARSLAQHFQIPQLEAAR